MHLRVPTNGYIEHFEGQRHAEMVQKVRENSTFKPLPIFTAQEIGNILDKVVRVDDSVCVFTCLSVLDEYNAYFMIEHPTSRGAHELGRRLVKYKLVNDGFDYSMSIIRVRIARELAIDSTSRLQADEGLRFLLGKSRLPPVPGEVTGLDVEPFQRDDLYYCSLCHEQLWTPRTPLDHAWLEEAGESGGSSLYFCSEPCRSQYRDGLRPSQKQHASLAAAQRHLDMTPRQRDEWTIACLALIRYERYREAPMPGRRREGGMLNADQAAGRDSITNRVDQVQTFLDTFHGHVDQEALRRT